MHSTTTLRSEIQIRNIFSQEKYISLIVKLFSAQVRFLPKIGHIRLIEKLENNTEEANNVCKCKYMKTSYLQSVFTDTIRLPLSVKAVYF